MPILLPDYACRPTGLCVSTYRTMRARRPESTELCVVTYRTMRKPFIKPLNFQDHQNRPIYRTMRNCDKNITDRTLVGPGRNTNQENGRKKGAQPTELCVAKSLSALEIKDPRPKGRGIPRRNGEPLSWGSEQDVGLADASA